VLRKRIDEFGVTEPLIQKVGEDRIVVELAGIRDPGRAKAIVQRSAFLEFRITDKTQALERALPAMDRQLRAMGVTSAGAAPSKQASAVEQLLGGDSARKVGDSTTAAAAAGTDSAKVAADTTPVTGGVLATLIKPGGLPGEYYVPENAFPRVDSLIARARTEADARKTWQQVLATLAEDYPAAVLFSRENVLPLPKRFTKVDLHPESLWRMVWTWSGPSRTR